MEETARYDGLAGRVLTGSALLSVLVMAHHPTSMHSGIGGPVHAAMILLIGLSTYGLLHIALRRGIGRPAMLAGAIAWGVALLGDIGAATINGFAVPALASRLPTVGPDVFALAWEFNQALARLGVVATGVAFLLWGHGLLHWQGWPAKALGALGLAAGLVPVALLLAGAVRMNVAGAILVYALESAWMFATGVYLWSGRFAKDLALSASGGM
ncbi:hypothetical protein [Sphingomonas sp.]|uniref:hypothetical protein n=1 Tax=Sphingomonas sp. TaxID=28214 RepID=UPI001B22C419|nr:hypothetical protein [Sphingomonas sp.]MBO9714984.1 hypothetical protein [Sphingomonas sp.]